ncbi:MAG TPA: hypothetical protein VN748_18455 [Pseudonocardiaceae bacterium]|nr:hypothetical protein [Pseudonocardiaceae bacterium]
MYEAGEGFCERRGGRGWLAVGDVEVEPGEDGLVEHFAGLVVGRVVEVAWPFEEFECGEQDGAARFEVVDGAVKLVGDALFAFPHLPHSCFDFVLWPFGVAEEVEESVFLAVEFAELRAEGSAELGRCLL